MPFQSFSSKVSGRAVSSPKEAESKNEDDDSDNHPGAGGNSGTMIVDATCAVQYPLSSGCFPAQRGQGEHRNAFGRSSRSRGRKEASNLPQTRPERLPEIHKMPKHTAKMTRKAIGKQLAYLRRDLDAIDGKLSPGKNLPPCQTERLGTIRTVYEQQKVPTAYLTGSSA